MRTNDSFHAVTCTTTRSLSLVRFSHGCYCSKIGAVFVLCRKETITRAIEFGYRQDRSEKMLAFDLRFVKFKIYEILKDHA